MVRRLSLGTVAGILLLALLATTLTACSKEEAAPGVTPAPDVAAPAVASQASTVDVMLQEFNVVATPVSVPAGEVTFNTKTDGPDDVHELVIVKVDMALADLPTDKDGALIEDAEGLEVIDEIEDLKDGDTQDMTVELEAGSYVLVCNIDKKEPDGSKESHFKMGMRSAFTVTDPSAAPTEPVAVPEGAAVYTVHEMGIEGPDTLPAGISDITVQNNGAMVHELVILRLDKHQDWTAEQAIEFVNAHPEAQPAWGVPVASTTMSRATVVGPGETLPVLFVDFSGGKPVPVEDGSLEAGSYLFMCFVGEPTPHALVGMIKKVTVT
jgi:hypothetical protein